MTHLRYVRGLLERSVPHPKVSEEDRTPEIPPVAEPLLKYVSQNCVGSKYTSKTPFGATNGASEIVSLARAKLCRGTSNNLCTAPY